MCPVLPADKAGHGLVVLMPEINELIEHENLSNPFHFHHILYSRDVLMRVSIGNFYLQYNTHTKSRKRFRKVLSF